MAGFPSPALTRGLIEAALEGGADIIELGIPYSDPLADGPVIQAAAQRALAAGMTFETALGALAGVRATAPVFVMTYYNPLFVRGLDTSAAEMQAAGCAGVIVPDLPLEESHALQRALGAHGLALTLLVAPTTPLARARAIAAHSAPFVYVVSRMGVTGKSQDSTAADAQALLAQLRSVTEKPLAIGFGISSPDDVQAVATHADGVIVGSALIEACASERPEAAVRELCASLRAACRRSSALEVPTRG